MKTLIIYDSLTGNTEKIARVMAKALKARLVKLNKANAKEISKYDLVGFGSGIYAMRHSKNLLRFAEKLPTTDKNAFIFSTAGSPSLKFIGHFALRRRLKAKGFRIIGEFSCKGLDKFGPLKLVGGINKGRPNAKDLKNAEKFAEETKSRV